LFFLEESRINRGERRGKRTAHNRDVELGETTTNRRPEMKELETLLRELAEALLDVEVAKERAHKPPEWGFKVGNKVLIRTVTFTYIGRVSAVTETEVHLTRACWVADTGRFGKTLAEGSSNISELEMFPYGVDVALGGIIDHSPWSHSLPTESTKD